MTCAPFLWTRALSYGRVQLSDGLASPTCGLAPYLRDWPGFIWTCHTEGGVALLSCGLFRVLMDCPRFFWTLPVSNELAQFDMDLGHFRFDLPGLGTVLPYCLWSCPTLLRTRQCLGWPAHLSYGLPAISRGLAPRSHGLATLHVGTLGFDPGFVWTSRAL